MRRYRSPWRRILGLCLTLVACDSSRPASQEEVERIILISIDTLRADALGCYGNANNPTPHLDWLANHGVLFENSIAPTPLTLPSHTTLLTGLHPLQHGVLVNSKTALSKEVGTLAEQLHDAGWKTGAIVSSAILHHRYGLARGFDDYRDNFFADMTVRGDNSFDLIDARVTTREAIEWIQSHRDADRFFLFLHYIDPHAPYVPPPRFARAFPDQPYLGEVAFVDAQVGRLMRFMEKENLLEGTLWIVTSDHGEALGQHGVRTHGCFLYDEIIRVPLILSGAGVEEAKVAHETVGLIDVAPTILDLAGLEPDPSLPGHVLRDPLPADRSMVSTSYLPSLVFGWSPLWSLWRKGEKFILAPEREYYATTVDPGEVDNIASGEVLRADSMEETLRRRAAVYMETMRKSEDVGIDRAGLAQLAALGYLAPSTSAKPARLDEFTGRDPKEMRAVLPLMDDFHTALTGENFADAHEFIDQVVALDPTNLALNEMTSQLLLQEDRYQELLDWLEEQPAPFRESATERYHRALALRHTGRGEEAIEVLRKTTQDIPSHVPSRYELALLLSLHGRPREAMAEYELVLEMDPRNEGGLLNYANLLSKSGRTEEAAETLGTLVSYNPGYVTAQRNLGFIYGKLGRNREAISQMQKYLGMDPEADDRAHIETVIAKLRQNP